MISPPWNFDFFYCIILFYCIAQVLLNRAKKFNTALVLFNQGQNH